MKIASSLKSLKKRDLNSKLVRRRGRVYIINKKNPKFKPNRKGERYASALTNMSLNNKIHKMYGKINLKDYVSSFIKGKKN